MQVQGHSSGDSVLVHHPEQLAIYSVATAVREAVWSPRDQSAFKEQHVVTATFSADRRARDSGILSGQPRHLQWGLLAALTELGVSRAVCEPGGSSANPRWQRSQRSQALMRSRAVWPLGSMTAAWHF